MSLNPGSEYANINFTKPENPNYIMPDQNNQQTFIGTIVAMQKVQARKYSMNGRPGAPDFWDDGNPKMNIRIALAAADGSIKTFTFPIAGKAQREGTKPSVHMDLYKLSGYNIDNLMGKTIAITTWPANPTNGMAWGNGNPRLFDIQLVNDVQYAPSFPVPHELTVAELYCNDGAAGGQSTGVAPQNIQTPIMQPQVQVQVPQPTVQQQPVQQAATVVTQPVTVQTTQPQVPVGMDANVAAAMQTLEATNVQPVANEPYDDIPF